MARSGAGSCGQGVLLGRVNVVGDFSPRPQPRPRAANSPPPAPQRPRPRFPQAWYHVAPTRPRSDCRTAAPQRLRSARTTHARARACRRRVHGTTAAETANTNTPDTWCERLSGMSAHIAAPGTRPPDCDMRLSDSWVRTTLSSYLPPPVLRPPCQLPASVCCSCSAAAAAS
jgi:hypothetical protein